MDGEKGRWKGYATCWYLSTTNGLPTCNCPEQIYFTLYSYRGHSIHADTSIIEYSPDLQLKLLIGLLVGLL